MSKSQHIWIILWNRAAIDPSPFEIDDALPEVMSKLGISAADARWATSGLLKELERLPDGRQFFCLEGNAVVPLLEFSDASKDESSALDAYPFED